jgi:phage protein U
MRTYLARLGSFQFGLDTAAFKELQRSSNFRWEAKNRIGRQPAQQNTGRGADTITLSGVIYPHFRGGLAQMDQLRQQARTGDPLPLVYAFESVGQFCGLWCVSSIEETRTVFFENGAPRKIEFRLSLVEYGEDFANDVGTQAATIALVSNAVGGVDGPAVAAVGNTAAAAAKVATNQAGALGAVGGLVTSAQTVVGAINTAVNSALNSDAMRLAKTTVAEIGKLKASVAGMQSAVTGLRKASGIGGTLSALGNLEASSGVMSQVLGTVSEKLVPTVGPINGTSPSSIYARQVASVTGTFGELATASTGIKSAAKTLKAFF